MSSVSGRTRLYFRRDGHVRGTLHPRRGEGAHTQGQILDLNLPRQTGRRMYTLEKVARISPKIAAAYRERDPSIRDGKILTYRERVAEDSPERNDLWLRVDAITGTGVFEREEIVQQIVVWLLDGTITWRVLLRNKSKITASAKRWLKRQGVIYDGFGAVSLDAPLGEDGLTLGDLLEG